MARWVHFSDRHGGTGIGTLEADSVRVHEGELFGASVAGQKTLPLAEIDLLAPCQPGKVVALWNNFHALGEKLGKAAPVHPLYLIKPGTSVIGPGAAIRRPPSYAGKIAFEGELAIVIGRTCSNVAVAEVDAYIFGYTCINDVTAAELVQADPNFPQWTRAKGFDTFSCLGPAICDDLDWKAARVVTMVDGAERQNYPISDMIFTPQAIVSGISQDMTLYPGDVIACGTSIGLGSMKDGATCEVTIEGIGTLSNQLAPGRG
jgi:2-keto-4-pentenoate hydratase/2-oxohepta-3-ene-1,7-dioic acid hydratase in catechol pathway